MAPFRFSITTVCLTLSLVGVCILAAPCVSPASAKGPWDFESLRQQPSMHWLDDKSPIRSLVFENQRYEGHPTEVFAFYASPATIGSETQAGQRYPAVVLLHGGGGTAFAEWAMLWAERGYAAIALDLCGNRPSPPQFDPATKKLVNTPRRGPLDRERMDAGGPPEGAQSKFKNVGGDVDDDWQYHAVSAAIKAHSLIRSFPDVDADRTAVTGISWGGYLTCLVASMDDRFKAAVPVYGCGFLYDSESVQRGQIDSLTPPQREQWIRDYEPSAWLPQCRVPILFVNGTNDKHYPLRAYDRSFKLVPGDRQIRIEVNMRHSHPHGWAPNEIGRFIDQHCLGAPPLPTLGPLNSDTGIASATLSSTVPIKRAQLHYTTDRGPLVDRQWKSRDAEFTPQKVSATIPPEATIWMLSVTDQRDGMVSTSVAFDEP